jgi:hypothetical protein
MRSERGKMMAKKFQEFMEPVDIKFNTTVNLTDEKGNPINSDLEIYPAQTARVYGRICKMLRDLQCVIDHEKSSLMTEKNPHVDFVIAFSDKFNHMFALSHNIFGDSGRIGIIARGDVEEVHARKFASDDKMFEEFIRRVYILLNPMCGTHFEENKVRAKIPGDDDKSYYSFQTETLIPYYKLSEVSLCLLWDRISIINRARSNFFVLLHQEYGYPIEDDQDAAMDFHVELITKGHDDDGKNIEDEEDHA